MQWWGALTKQFKALLAVAKVPPIRFHDLRHSCATFLLEAGNVDQAYPLVEGALRFDADHLPGHLLLGDCYRLQGKYAEAKQRFDVYDVLVIHRVGTLAPCDQIVMVAVTADHSTSSM